MRLLPRKSSGSNARKVEEGTRLERLLRWSLWIARVYILTTIACIPLASLGQSTFGLALSDTRTASHLALVVAGNVLALIYFLTVQTILSARALNREIPASGRHSRWHFALAIADCALLIIIAVGSDVDIIWFGGSQKLSIRLALLALGFLQVVFVCWLVVLRIMIMRESNRRCSFAPFYDGSEHNGQRVKPQSLTFDRKSSGLRGEHALIIVLRVLILVFFIAGIVVYAINVTIVEFAGITESQTSLQISRTGYPVFDPDNKVHMLAYVRLAASQESSDAVEQSIRFAPNVTAEPSSASRSTKNATNDDIYISCGIDQPNADLFVTVDFATLNNVTSNSSFTNAVAYVYLGASGSFSRSPAVISDIVRSKAIPFPLLPGAHYHAFVLWEWRETFDSPSWAFWGLFNRKTTYHIGNTFRYFPDPSPPVVAEGNTQMATLRLTYVNERVIQYTTIAADHQEATVVKVLSSVGGLVTSLSGIFAFFFGGGLLYYLLGSKPLGVFGALHYFQVKQLVELNSIPKPYTQLERFLGRFFIDFGQEERDEEPSSTSKISYFPHDSNNANVPPISNTPYATYDPYVSYSGIAARAPSTTNNDDENDNPVILSYPINSDNAETIAQRRGHRHQESDWRDNNSMSIASRNSFDGYSYEYDEVALIKGPEKGIRMSRMG